MSSSPPGPARRLVGTRVLLSLMLALNTLGLIMAALVKVLHPTVAYFEGDLDLVYGPQPYVLQQANRHLWPETLIIAIRDPSLVQMILGMLSHGLAVAIVSVPMIIFARRLVDHAIANHPFTVVMARGLRRLGLVVLLGGLVAEVVQHVAGYLLYRSAVHSGPYAYTDWRIDLWWLLLGLVILSFGQIIEHGCELRTELDEVI